MHRVFNFASGPATLPVPVLEQAQRELLDWHGRGYSIMEISHRSPEFVAIIEECESMLRELMNIPANYRVLFMQGGGHQQFSMVPINLLRAKFQADYIVSGHWSKAAVVEAERFCKVSIAASTAAQDFRTVPSQSQLQLSDEAAYVYYCPNETIHGLQFDYVPTTGDVPLVADASSEFLSRTIDVSKFGVIYACAQKNFGPAGLTAVIIRQDLVGHASNRWPTMLDYKAYDDAKSLWNTPATYSIYLAHLVLKWLAQQGGVAAIETRNEAKAALLYGAIDASGGFYSNSVGKAVRSRMNVPFSLADSNLDASFIASAAEHQIVQIKGHRAVGGMRASLYNAMPIESVQVLVQYMQEFQRIHG